MHKVDSFIKKSTLCICFPLYLYPKSANALSRIVSFFLLELQNCITISLEQPHSAKIDPKIGDYSLIGSMVNGKDRLGIGL